MNGWHRASKHEMTMNAETIRKCGFDCERNGMRVHEIH